MPLQAPEEDIKPFDTGDPQRDILMGMIKRMDLAVGDVVDALKANGVWENTLIFYFSDNGGARATHASNLPLRDYKQSVYEGGLRVPFFVSWPGHLEAGGVCHEPVICMDILPTVCAAVGIPLPEGRIYDGKNMLPVLQGKADGPLHDALYWDGDSGPWAIREGK
jgi:arylsulfatase A-like enzyme